MVLQAWPGVQEARVPVHPMRTVAWAPLSQTTAAAGSPRLPSRTSVQDSSSVPRPAQGSLPLCLGLGGLGAGWSLFSDCPRTWVALVFAVTTQGHGVGEVHGQPMSSHPAGDTDCPWGRELGPAVVPAGPPLWEATVLIPSPSLGSSMDSGCQSCAQGGNLAVPLPCLLPLIVGHRSDSQGQEQQEQQS